MSARYMQPLRILVQYSFLAFMVWLGVSFYRFVQAVSSVPTAAVAVRPDGIDGFLPISGLLGTASWIKGGGINSIHPAAV
ncbi:4Fe-4S binding protein, partial [Candidatus Roizmanbacteria bacterium]|nr:4Fe-4S binding protein [Candidatus Roizmanbacteria bacterium]